MDLPKFGYHVQHLIVDAFFGEQSQASASKLTETLKNFAGKTLESMTFITRLNLGHWQNIWPELVTLVVVTLQHCFSNAFAISQLL